MVDEKDRYQAPEDAPEHTSGDALSVSSIKEPVQEIPLSDTSDDGTMSARPENSLLLLEVPTAEHADASRTTSDGLSEQNKRFYAGAWILLAATILLSLANLTQEWLYHHQGWCGSRRSIAAKNYLRYGYINTRFGPIDNPGLHKKKDGSPKKLSYYWHHPPFVSLTLSTFFAVFGESEAVARYMSALFSFITFLFLWLSFRNHWGDTPTFYALAILTFMPLYATYNNFVNYETAVLMWIAISIAAYERYLGERTRKNALLFFFTLFMGAYADFPMFVWMFFLWLIMGIRAFFVDRPHLRFFGWYILAVFVMVALIVGQMYLWKQAGYYSLWSNRYKAHQDFFGSVHGVLKTWGYFYGHFGPVAYGFAAYYLGDFACRLYRRRVTRADGYLIALGLAGLVYVVALKDGARIHAFFIWYFTVFIGLAGGYGLYRFLMLLKRIGLPRVHVFGVTVVLFAIIWALPVIHMKRTNPHYNYKNNIILSKNEQKFDYGLDYRIAVLLTHDASDGDAHILLDDGLPIRRFEFTIALDRTYTVVRGSEDLPRKIRSKKPTHYLVDARKIDSTYLQYLTKKYRFIVYKSFYIFDLTGKRLKHIEAKRQIFLPRGDILRYFTSMTHGKFDIVDHPLKALDYAIKWEKKPSIDYYRKALFGKKKKKPTVTDLEGALAVYNNNKTRGKKATLGPLFEWIDKPEKSFTFGALKLIGQRVIKRYDGRSELLLAFQNNNSLDVNYVVVVEAKSTYEDETIRKRIGTQRILQNTIIPASKWKTGLIYSLRIPLDLDTGPYELNFQFKYRDSITVFNPKDKKDHFKYACHQWPTSENHGGGEVQDTEATIRKFAEFQNKFKSSEKRVFQMMDKKKLEAAFKRKKLDDKFTIWGCFTDPRPNKKGEYRTSIFLRSEMKAQRNWAFDIFTGEAPKSVKLKDRRKKKKRKKTKSPMRKRFHRAMQPKPGEFFWIEFNAPFQKEKRDIEVRAYMKFRKGSKSAGRQSKKAFVGAGDFGIERPFSFIESLLWDPWLGVNR